MTVIGMEVGFAKLMVVTPVGQLLNVNELSVPRRCHRVSAICVVVVLLEGLVVICRRMLGALDRAAIMAGVNVGLSKTRIAHLIGRSPSVVCREIARHTGPDGQYRAEEADKAARAARRRPKKRLLDCDEILRDRVIADLSQGHTPRQISAPPA